ncbi:MAG: RlmE family RNA methyltransferase [Polyangiaceae bacterium]|nr:RlmE family RNA methyltransferase [Polyangiaceae bacterium]
MPRNPYQRADHRTRQARALGYPARSIFKLEEIDRRVKLLRPGQHVLDLGAAPGSWSMYAAERVGPHGRILAIDLRAIDRSLGPNVDVVRGDALDLEQDVLARCAPYDVVLSDMAPATSGNRETDHARSASLFERALRVSEALTKPGGAFVAKLFMGDEFERLRDETRTAFSQVKFIRPQGTRTNSVELFVVGLGRRVAPPTPTQSRT